jgi:hypothetical protein
MKHLTILVMPIGTSLLLGCASLRPRDYGFEPVAMSGEEYYCAPREWVVPPVVPQEVAGDPDFPLYGQFLKLPLTSFVPNAHRQTPEVCITQAQWPKWLMMRNQWKGDWPITPRMAEERAAQLAAGL